MILNNPNHITRSHFLLRNAMFRQIASPLPPLFPLPFLFMLLWLWVPSSFSLLALYNVIKSYAPNTICVYNAHIYKYINLRRFNLYLSPKIKTHIAKKLLDISTWISNTYLKLNVFNIISTISIIKSLPFIQARNSASSSNRLPLSFLHISKCNQVLILCIPTGCLTPCFLLPSSICKYCSHFLSFLSSLQPKTLEFSLNLP